VVLRFDSAIKGAPRMTSMMLIQTANALTKKIMSR
jgi:hypothetical protein